MGDDQPLGLSFSSAAYPVKKRKIRDTKGKSWDDSALINMEDF
jgi:hypothetical protein